MAEGTQLGKYTLKRRLATGGMAEIWLAEQRGPGGFAKELVVKQILPHLANDQTFVQMFLDEARLAAQLTHPNIVQIYDLGEADGSYFIAMEYIRGHDLAQLLSAALNAGAPLDPLAASRIIADACGGLDFAHHFADSRGRPLNLVHRDVSPQNILVSDQGAVKLVDFGVAKAANSTHKTQTGAVKGKFAYMSPEQISGKQLDGRSDLFAMGIVLFELLTGKRPFGHDSELLAVTAILHHPAPDVAELNPSTPDALRDVVARALEKDPAQRWPTAESMQSALEAVLSASGQPVNRKTLAVYLGSLFSGSPKSLASSISTMPTHIGGSRPTEEGVPFSLRHSQSGPVGDKWPAHPGTPPGAQPAPPAGPPSGPPPGSAPAAWSPGAQPAPAAPGMHERATRALDTKPNVSVGLRVAIALVFLALAGAGYFLYDAVSNKNAGGSIAEGSGGEAESGEAETGAAGADAGRVAAGADASPPPQADVGPTATADLDAGATIDAGAVAQADTTGLVPLDGPDLGLLDAVVASADTSQLLDDAGQLAVTDAELVLVTDAGVVSDALVALADAGPALDDAGATPEADLTVVVTADTGVETDAGAEPDGGAVALADIGELASDTGLATADAAVVTPENTDAGAPDAVIALADAGPTEPEADLGGEDTGAVAVVEEDAGEPEADVEETTERPTQNGDEEERRDRRPGNLMVVVSPPGRYEILVDGEVVGRTPMPRHSLPAGRYRVTVRRIGERETRGERVRIRPGRTETIRIEMD